MSVKGNSLIQDITVGCLVAIGAILIAAFFLGIQYLFMVGLVWVFLWGWAGMGVEPSLSHINPWMAAVPLTVVLWILQWIFKSNVTVKKS
jgi:hypothetical protein